VFVGSGGVYWIHLAGYRDNAATSGSALGPQSLLKQPEHETNHAPPSSDEVKLRGVEPPLPYASRRRV
jgi:hypothetical protein